MIHPKLMEAWELSTKISAAVKLTFRREKKNFAGEISGTKKKAPVLVPHWIPTKHGVHSYAAIACLGHVIFNTVSCCYSCGLATGVNTVILTCFYTVPAKKKWILQKFWKWIWGCGGVLLPLESYHPLCGPLAFASVQSKWWVLIGCWIQFIRLACGMLCLEWSGWYRCTVPFQPCCYAYAQSIWDQVQSSSTVGPKKVCVSLPCNDATKLTTAFIAGLFGWSHC